MSSLFFIKSCDSKSQNKNEQKLYEETYNDIQNIINNSKVFEYTRVLICKNDWDELFLYPDLPIVYEGKFDSETGMFIEINRRKYESPFEHRDLALTVENKNEWLDENRVYQYDIEIRNNYVLFLDKSIKPKNNQTGIFSGVKAGFIVYTKGYDNNKGYYNKLISEEFKH